jgi:hypothetical protein
MLAGGPDLPLRLEEMDKELRMLQRQVMKLHGPRGRALFAVLMQGICLRPLQDSPFIPCIGAFGTAFSLPPSRAENSPCILHQHQHFLLSV